MSLHYLVKVLVTFSLTVTNGPVFFVLPYITVSM